MSINKITAADIERNSVERLANRPGDRAGLGQGGLSASQLKTFFSALSKLSIDKVNEIIDAFGNGESESELMDLLYTSLADTRDDTMKLSLSKWVEQTEQKLADVPEKMAEMESVIDGFTEASATAQSLGSDQQPSVTLHNEVGDDGTRTVRFEFSIPRGSTGDNIIEKTELPQKWYDLNEKLEDGHKIMGGLIYKDMDGNVQVFPLAPAYGVRKDECGESIPVPVLYNTAQQIMCKPATDGRHAVSLQQLDKFFGGTDGTSEKTFSITRVPPVDTSVPIAQRRQYVFCRDSENNFAGKYYTAAAHARSLAERDDYGNIQIQAPVVDSHAVTLGFLKTYVSEEIAKIPNAEEASF